MKDNLISIPTKPEDITLEWLNLVLKDNLKNHAINSYTANYSFESGNTSEVIDIHLKYNNPDCLLPTRMIAKLDSQNPEVKQMIDGLGFYIREAKFYKDFLDIGFETAKCYYSDYNVDTQQMVILLEHLAPASSPSWGINIEQVEYACNALSIFHSKWWNDQTLKSKDCLLQIPSEDFLLPLLNAAHSGTGSVFNIFGKEANTSIDCINVFSEKFDIIMNWVKKRPFTLVHGDYHAKQLFFPTKAGGQFAVIDWQYPFVAPGMWDLARMLALCVDTTTRLLHQDNIIQNYLSQLTAQGIINYSREDLDMDLKIAALYSQTLQMVVVPTIDLGDAEKECKPFGIDWRDIYFLRGNSLLKELATLEFIESL